MPAVTLEQVHQEQLRQGKILDSLQAKAVTSELDVTRWDPTGALRPSEVYGTRDPGPWPRRR